MSGIFSKRERGVRSRTLLIGCVVSALMMAGPAYAACPSPFNGLQCDGDPAAAEWPACGVTTVGSISVITCDLGLDGETTATAAKFVSPTATTFRAYGVAGDGESFCCELSVQDGCANQRNTLYVHGTTQQDALDLYDSAQSQDMDCSNSYVYGDADDDTISGSRLTTNYDQLFGEDDDDTIYGLGGGDVIHGGDSFNGDVLHGNDGADTIYGDEGEDFIYGDDGPDYCSGDDGSGTLAGDGKNHIEGGMPMTTSTAGIPRTRSAASSETMSS